MDNLTLYHFPKSSCSRKVIFVLNYKVIPYQEVIINLEQAEQRQPDFLKLNPLGQVPVLVYNDQIIRDSAVINEFLEEKFPSQSLLPTNQLERAKVRMSTVYADQVFYPQISAILREFRHPPASRNEKIITEYLHSFQEKGLTFLEQQLQKQTNSFLFDQLTLADIAYAPGLDTLIRVSGLSLSSFPAVAQWFKTIATLPAFRSTLPLVSVK